ncbi:MULTISPECIES: DUF1345 domain-containing protein [Pseudonocardia]|uniref:Uncharacterized protein n=1 Tax=Pseudonocardia saturnea TaxID=33909 RepID=A0ABQ0S3N6_9PSEU|nr:hypothetical protein Pdca_21230 [Pseudonocardia autotrophica]GEC27527.1 hypothetical protein PSA01_45560 [Pseudonocardia saturnea]
MSTSFGTGDVTVTTREMRRTVVAHSVLAFVFTTLILAVTVSAVATLMRPGSRSPTRTPIIASARPPDRSPR